MMPQFPGTLYARARSRARILAGSVGISRAVIYGELRRSMTDRAARAAAAGSRADLGPRLIDDFDDDLADGTIARCCPTGILSLRSSCCCCSRVRASSSPLRRATLGDVSSPANMQTGISLLTELGPPRASEGFSRNDRKRHPRADSQRASSFAPRTLATVTPPFITSSRARSYRQLPVNKLPRLLLLLLLLPLSAAVNFANCRPRE
jgi:hypothetical protein